MSELMECRDPSGELPALVERMRPKLVALFFRFRLSQEDAEDVLQSALVQALVRWGEIRNIDGWLYGTVFRMCHGTRWSRWRREVVPMDPQSLELLGGAGPPPQEQLDRRADVERVCRSLTPRQGQVLMLRHGHGLKASEVAAEIGVQPQSVRKLARRAMVQARAELGADQKAPARRRGRQRRTGRPLREGSARSGGQLLMISKAAAFTLLCPAVRLLSAQAWRALSRELATPWWVPCRPLGPPLRAEHEPSGVGVPGETNGGAPGGLEPVPAVPAGSQGAVVTFASRGADIHPDAAPGSRLDSAELEADVPWVQAMESFLARYADGTRACYVRELARAGNDLGWPLLGTLTSETLREWRRALLGDGRRPAAHSYALSVVRSFLAWSGEQGSHALPPKVLRAALAQVRPANAAAPPVSRVSGVSAAAAAASAAPAAPEAARIARAAAR